MENGNNSRARIGFALCGSFCTLKKMTDQLERLAEPLLKSGYGRYLLG